MIKWIDENADRLVIMLIFVQLNVTFWSALLSSLKIYYSYFFILPDSFGYSLFSNLISLAYIVRRKLPKHNHYLVFGLILSNVVSLLTINTDFYNPISDLIIVLTFVSITTINALR